MKGEAEQNLLEFYTREVYVPSYLRNSTDIMALYDWTQPQYAGRWTGLELLPLIQAHHVALAQSEMEGRGGIEAEGKPKGTENEPDAEMVLDETIPVLG